MYRFHNSIKTAGFYCQQFLSFPLLCGPFLSAHSAVSVIWLIDVSSEDQLLLRFEQSDVTELEALSFPVGSALEKAGGDEFKEEVKKLSESHGPLELAAGKTLIKNRCISFTSAAEASLV